MPKTKKGGVKMPTSIDELQIEIQGTAKDANASINALVKNLDNLQSRISKLDTSRFKSLSVNTSNLSANVKKMESISKQVTESLEQITEKYKDLGKGFSFSGSFDSIQKQVDKYSNALENAKLKKQELELSGKTEGKMYEYAVRDVLKYENILQKLKKQLKEIQEVKPHIEINITGISNMEEQAKKVAEKIRTVSIPESSFNYDPGAMAAVFGEAASEIKNYGQAIEQFGKNAGQVLNKSTRLYFKIDGIENAEQKLESFSGQIQNMKNMFLQMFSNVKSGDLWNYLTSSVSNYIKKAQTATGIKVYTEDYKKILNDIERTEVALEKLEQKQRDMQAMGTEEESRKWKKVVSEIAAAEIQLNSYISKRNEMESKGADVDFLGGLANQSWIKNAGAVASESMASLRQSIANIGTAVSQSVGNIPIIGRIAKESAFIGQKGFESFKLALSGVTSVLKKMSSLIKNGLVKDFSKLTNVVKGSNNSFTKGLSTILKYGLGIRSLFTLFNKLRNAIKEGMNNLVQYSSNTNSSISLLKNSTNQLKNSVASMVAPLINLLAPALNQIIQVCIKAANAVNQLLSALTGKSTWVKAKKQTEDYADSVNNASNATKNALAPFDKLNNITKNEGTSGSGTSAEDMFETVNIQNQFNDMAKRIKDMWSNADFTELGTIIGTKLKNALDSINWIPIKQTASKIGKSIATFINGGVEVENFSDSIGKTIGEGINTGISFANSFLDNTHWDSVGNFIGEGLNGVVNTVDWIGIGHLFSQKFNSIFEIIGNVAITFDWTNLGKSLSDSVNMFVDDFNWAENGKNLGELAKGLLDTIITFFAETDWNELGRSIAEFVGNIDWSEVIGKLVEGIIYALSGLAGILIGIIQKAWDSVVEWWEDVAYEDGEFTMQGLLDGITEKLSNIGTWVKEHIFQPFIDGFKNAFGIHSPSKEMKEQGGYIIAGLWEGIKDSWTNITDFFSEKLSELKETISSAWKNIETKTSNIWNNIKEKIGNTWDNIKKITKDWYDKISSFFEKDKWSFSGIKEGFSNAFNSAINGIKLIWNTFANWLNSILNWTVPPLVVAGKTLFSGTTINLGVIPTFATGGFPEDGWFRASKGEYFGSFDDGTSVVANNNQIISGIANGVKDANAEQNALLREQNALLRQILAKDVGISTRDIFDAVRTENRDYINRNGESAFAF